MVESGPGLRRAVRFGLSYREVAKRAIDGLIHGTSGRVTLDRINGNSLQPEGRAVPEWQGNPQQAISMTQCFGCWTQCGVRVRVDRQTDRVLRIAGNPYHPLSQERHVDSALPLQDALAQLGGESGLDARSTARARRHAAGGFTAAARAGADEARRQARRGQVAAHQL